MKCPEIHEAHMERAFEEVLLTLKFADFKVASISDFLKNGLGITGIYSAIV